VATSNEQLWLPLHPGEKVLVQRASQWLRHVLRRDDRLVSPLSVGHHLDHQLTRLAAETLRRPIYYYADYPYSANNIAQLTLGLPAGQIYRQSISEEALHAWQAGVAAYSSQVVALFQSHQRMLLKLSEFWESGGGSFLWLT
jgi:hypothetical protein